VSWAWSVDGVAYRQLGTAWVNIMAGDEFVCSVHRDSPHKTMITAAPDLYAALTKARDTINAVYVQMGVTDEGRATNLAHLDAALAKATGK
jgi:hypothetical protein